MTLIRLSLSLDEFTALRRLLKAARDGHRQSIDGALTDLLRAMDEAQG